MPGGVVGTPGGLGVLGRPFQKARRGWETHPDDWDGSVGPPREPGGLGGSSGLPGGFMRVGRGRDALPEVQKGSGGRDW